MTPSNPSADPLVPLIWLKRLGLLLVVLGAGALVYLLWGVLVPFLLAWIAAYLCEPLVDVLERRLKLKRENAVIAVMTAAALFVLILIAITIPIAIEEAGIFAQNLPAYKAKALATLESLQRENRIPPKAIELAQSALEELQASAPQIATTVGTYLYSWLGSLLSIFSFLMDFLLFVFIFFYFLRDYHQVNDRTLAAVPPAWREPLRELLNEIDQALRAVLRGQFLVAASMAACYTIGLWVVGVPYAILIGPAAGFGNFLPYVGPILGLTPAFLFVALHSLSDPVAMLWQFGYIGIVIGIVQFLEGFVLTPKLAGESAGLGPVAVLFALSVGGVLLGIVGVVVALPLAAILKVLLARGWAWYTGSAFYGAKGAD